KYGVDHVFQDPIIKNQIVETCMEKYDVRNVMQYPPIADKSSKNAYLARPYRFPSGRVDHIQGYECYALDDLLFKYHVHEDDIITSRTQVPEIWYYGNDDKKHRYFIDIFIIKKNRGIEEKSTRTYDLHTEQVHKKQQAMIDYGYAC